MCLLNGDLNLAEDFGVSPGRLLIEVSGDHLVGLETLPELTTGDCAA